MVRTLGEKEPFCYAKLVLLHFLKMIGFHLKSLEWFERVRERQSISTKRKLPTKNEGKVDK